MDMASMTMTTTSASTMDMAATPTSDAAAATSSPMNMGGGGMGGMAGGSCKISMLWNWYTVDSCFISRQWHVTSDAGFAGSCIGVVLLVIALEALRRLTKEYDMYLVRKHAASTPDLAVAAIVDKTGSADERRSGPPIPPVCSVVRPGYRPTVLQQSVRALLHMLQFAVAYFVMLMAMYYNGYIIISIFIGAYIGSFIFQWESLGARGSTSAANEATVCCG